MKRLFKKTVLLAVVAALAVAAMPSVRVFALGSSDLDAPPVGQISDEKLEQVWARQLQALERIGKGFDRLDELTTRMQNLIDRAAANGQDVEAVQAALDAFGTSTKDALPLYKSTQGLVNSHQGFDENGKVTNSEKARETVQAMRDQLQEMRLTMDGTGRALREAIKALREANPRPIQTN